tara:strand:- start:4760 stop:5068 length:309 start_codon:yes stop_codon:yes gene_type:complete
MGLIFSPRSSTFSLIHQPAMKPTTNPIVKNIASPCCCNCIYFVFAGQWPTILVDHLTENKYNWVLAYYREKNNYVQDRPRHTALTQEHQAMGRVTDELVAIV